MRNLHNKKGNRDLKLKEYCIPIKIKNDKKQIANGVSHALRHKFQNPKLNSQTIHTEFGILFKGIPIGIIVIWLLFVFWNLFFGISVCYAQTITPISELKINDSNGSPINLGKSFTVSGVVTSSNQFGYNGPGSIDDGTAGISVYNSDFVGKVNIGDSVTITSTLDQYSGLTQFNFSISGSSLTVHKSDCYFDTITVTIKQIQEQAWNGFEYLEGRLVRINNVTISGTGYFSGGTSGTNYPVSDSTGQLELRIDKDVNIVGMPIPASSVNIIGVLGQYKYGAPYNSGYQILPRFTSDIITDARPQILHPVYATNIDTASFTVYFSTIRNGNSKVKYGLTTALEQDSVVIDNDTTFHQVKISGLNSLTKYYYKAYSTNEIGTSESGIQSASTSTSNPEIGSINVYFNFSVDTTIAITGNNANGNANFTNKLVDRINSASYSIDMAVYSFNGLNDVTNALISAKNRGVKIRIVYENRTMQSSMQQLLNAGIKMNQRPALDGIMHNKYFIFDARDVEITNDWVWTGSFNLTSLELNWKNNVVEINDPALAAAYQTEFEEMWGSNNDEPNSSNSKFGMFKTDNTIHSFNVGGRQVELYFSPSDQTENKIVHQMQKADSSIYFGILSFTSNDIGTQIKNASLSGITDIKGIIDNVNDSGSEYDYLKSFADVWDYNLSNSFHHKYGVIDASYPASDPVVITGSHNWSNAANTVNDENTLIIHDLYIANQYMQEFKSRYNELGGTGKFVVPVISAVDSKNNNSLPSEIVLYQNYPNPFNPITSIAFFLPKKSEVELSIFNMLGEKVVTIFKGTAFQGKNVFDFNAENLSSGIYLYQLKTSNSIQMKKLMLMK